MYPYLIRIGGFSIPSYPVLYGLGIALAGIILLILGKRDRYNIRNLTHITLILSIAIVVGGRVFFVLQHINEFYGKWGEMFDLSKGGQVFYGGLILALLSLVIYCKWSHMSIRKILDLVVIGVPLGLVVGRLGCYCRGCCYGKITDVYWAVTFPKHIDITGYVVGSPTYLHHLNQGLISKMDISSLPVHPAQIYSSLASLIIFVIMLYMWKTKRFSGQLFFIYLIIYSISRFILEIFRDNELAFKNITIPQVISIFVLILGISGFIYQRWCMPYFRK